MATYLIGNVKGPKGEDGYSPKASVQQTSTGAIISIQDADGITTAEIRNGIDADGNIIDLSPYATKVEVEGQIDALADTYSTIDYVDDEIAKVQAPVTSVNGMVGDVVINQPDLTGYATTTWVTGQGYLTEAPVATVNGQAGTVVLDAEDVGALPDDTVIPTNVSDLTNDSGFLNATTLAPYLAGKQDTLTAGANITIQNNVISASGGSSFSGDYDDLTNKPDLSVYAETADLATVATTGDYDDLTNKPTIPTVPTNVSDFTNDAGYITSADLPADELPTITTGDAGKVLVVNSNEDGVEWTTASSSGTTYSAGDGIEIDANNEISVDTDIVATKIMEDDHDGTQEYASLELDFGGIASVWNNADGDYVNGSWLSSTEIGIDHMTYDQVEQDWVTDSSTVIMPNSITLNDGDGEAIISKHRGLDLMVSDGVDSKTIAYVEDLPSGGGADTLVINGQQWNATTLAPLIERYQDEQTAYSSITQVEGNGKTANWRLMEIASSSSTSLYIFYVRDNYYYNWNESNRIDVLKITLNPSNNYSFTNATVRNITIPFNADQLYSGLNASTAPSGTSNKTTAYELTYIKNNYATKTDIAAKQDTLTAGTGISISNNVISATGASGGSNEYVITVSATYPQMGDTDKTFAEVEAAYVAGKTLILKYIDSTNGIEITGDLSSVAGDSTNGYTAFWFNDTYNPSTRALRSMFFLNENAINQMAQVSRTELQNIASALTLTSPNGTEYTITVDNNGNLSAVAA